MLVPLGSKMASPFSRAWRLRASLRGCPGRASGCGLSGSAVAGPRWKLFGALCLQRLPVLSQATSPEEKEMAKLVQQVEVEKSLYSNYELRSFTEKARLQRIMEKGYDEEDGGLGKEVVLMQDLEDMWEQKLKKFGFAPRFTDADKTNDRTSLNRKLDQNLLLVVKQKVEDQTIWLLPQTEWKEGETLRDTAERALTDLSGAPIPAKFLGNAPCGFYKDKYPKAHRAEGNLGAKVFFFKAFLQDSSVPLTRDKADYVWVSKEELPDYLTPAYHSQVARFFVDL